MSTPPSTDFSAYLRPTVVRSLWRYLPSATAIAFSLLLLTQFDSVRGIEAVYGLTVAGILLGVGVWDLAARVLGDLKARAAEKGAVEQGVPVLSDPQHAPMRALMIAALLVVCALLLPLIGYFAVVPILIVPTMLVAGIRSARRIVLVSGATWVSAYVIFDLVLGVPLPSGGW